MSREHPEYRDNLEQILASTGGRHLLTLADVARFTGRDKRTCAKRWQIGPEGVTAASLARRLCGGTK